MNTQNIASGASRKAWFSGRLALAVLALACVGAAGLALNATRGPQAGARAGEDGLVVHEWGTFTALQDENGDAVGAVNVDDEPAPGFVHTVSYNLLTQPHALAERQRWMESKGIPRRNRSVTMRLETPVIYFHPPAGAKPFDASVEVAMQGGWLTEFYPHAKAETPGMFKPEPAKTVDDKKDVDPNSKNPHLATVELDAFLASPVAFRPLTSDTIGKLSWPQVTVGGDAPGPATEDRVWTTPRKPQAASVTVPVKEGVEHEKFLFYRGVGHLDLPIKVITDESHDAVIATWREGCVGAVDPKTPIAGLWLVHVKPNGDLAFRVGGPVGRPREGDGPRPYEAVIGRSFAGRDYSQANRAALREAMLKVMVSEGLFDDEAQAMLDTWQKAYFENAGLRVFFVAPRSWTDAVLPLKITPAAKIERVMIGRVELISSEQRALLKTLSTMEPSDREWLKKAWLVEHKRPQDRRVDSGELGIPISKDYETYLKLGRFRDALVLMEAERRPTPQWSAFLSGYGIRSYYPAEHPADGKTPVAPVQAASEAKTTDARAASTGSE